jgi:hypothetical protein
MVEGGVILPARLPRAMARFEELRNQRGTCTIVHAPRISSRAEDGPVQLDVYELFPDGG